MNFYKHYMGDYQRDTMRLSMVEDGAYRRLLDEYYATEQPLPLDHAECYRAARAISPEEQAAVDKVLERYFTRQDDGYHNRKADELIEKANAQAETNRRISEQRERKRKANEEDTNRATNRATNRETTKATNAEPNQTPDSRHQTINSVPNGTGASRATDPAKLVFDSTVRLLGSYGIPERKARTLAGKWRRGCRDPDLLALLAEAGRAERGDIVEYIEGALRNGPKRHENSRSSPHDKAFAGFAAVARDR